MAEENQQQEQNQEPPAPQYTATEQEAMKFGWRPKEEYEGGDDDFVSAREFINRKSLFDRINRDKVKLEKLEKTVQALVTHNEKVFQAGYQQAMDELQAARDHAIREGDDAAVRSIDEKKRMLQDRMENGDDNFSKEIQKIEKEETPVQHPAWEPWLEQNSWYARDMEMHGAADGIAQSIINEAKQNGKQIDYSQMLNEVARRIRGRFPDKFEAPVTQRTRDVNKDDKNSSSGKTGSLSRRLQQVEAGLDDGEREIMNTIISQTGMTKEKYLSDIEKTNRRK